MMSRNGDGTMRKESMKYAQNAETEIDGPLLALPCGKFYPCHPYQGCSKGAGCEGKKKKKKKTNSLVMPAFRNGVIPPLYADDLSHRL
jgi:hypothetical protein